MAHDRVLVFGGNRFLGVEVVTRLLARGAEVTLVNRGSLKDPFGPLVKRVHLDRSRDPLEARLRGGSWDGVVDLSLFTAADAERTARALRGKVGHYVMISTGQVYLVRKGAPAVARESDYDGPLLPEPAGAYDRDQWRYGMEKREAEAVIHAAFPATRLRLPMVHGGRDFYRRLDSVVARVLDGGPLLLTRPEAPVRHLFAPAAARAIDALLTRPPTGEAFNLAQREAVTVREFLGRVAACLGAPARLLEVEPRQLEEADVDPLQACPFNATWMSALDARLAQRQLGFHHEDLDTYLASAVYAGFSRWQGAPPTMAQRTRELRLARALER
jgi:nucleoside-diphosphate-sugar epimerase